MRNARQIRDIVLAVFGPQIFESSVEADAVTESNTDYRELALGWQKLADSYSKGASEGDNSQLVISVAKVGLRYVRCSSDINKCLVASACPGGP